MTTSPPSDISTETIENAARLIGLSFTETECEQMRDVLNDRLAAFQSLREFSLLNHDTFPLNFNPHPPSYPGTAASATSSAALPRTYPLGVQQPVTRPDDLEDVAFYSIVQLAELIRTRQVTSTELTTMYIQRLKRHDETLKCVVTLTEDLAMSQAKQADDDIAQGRYRGVLHGIPWGAKDLLAVPGYPTTWGAAPYRDQMLDTTATVVERLNAAGAVLIAKLSMGALAFGDVWFGGTTKNPWNIEDGSGGSSAGPGAATAAGLVGFSIGTETLGSIINPSTRCGISGFRPTFGRVSRHGAMALSWSMDKIGPMCRTVEDCALVFSAIYGADGHDLSVTAAPFRWDRTRNPRDLRIGYLQPAFDKAAEDHDEEQALSSHISLEQRNRRNTPRVLDELRSQGFDLVPITLPEVDYSALFMILLAEAAAAFDDLTRSDSDDTLTRQDDNAWPNLFRAARFIPAVEYIQANRIRGQLMQSFSQAIENIDVLVAPTFGGDMPLITNMTGHPAISVPNGFTNDTLPTSISFIGHLNREDELLSVAHAYQQATDYHQMHPPAFV